MMFKANLQFSNNKEKKKKKEKIDENSKKIKTKFLEESTMETNDVPIASTSDEFDDSKPSPSSPIQTIVVPTLPIPISPAVSRSPLAQQSNVAHLSQIQQQLQSLAQMTNDGDEIFITLNINTLTPKQKVNYNSTMDSYSPQGQNSNSNKMTIPTNLEIVAKGFARIRDEYSYSQQQRQTALPRLATSDCCNTGLPLGPIAPPIQPVFLPLNPADFTSHCLSNDSAADNQYRSFAYANQCNHLCQFSLHQADFRYHPWPGITSNPYQPPSTRSKSFSAKDSSGRKYDFVINYDDMNRTYSPIY